MIAILATLVQKASCLTHHRQLHLFERSRFGWTCRREGPSEQGYWYHEGREWGPSLWVLHDSDFDEVGHYCKHRPTICLTDPSQPALPATALGPLVADLDFAEGLPAISQRERLHTNKVNHVMIPARTATGASQLIAVPMTTAQFVPSTL